MNDFRNLGNANAALAVLNFNHHDHLADEFIHRLFCLVGEDAPEALVDNYFNEAQVMETLNKILDDLPLFDNDILRPAGMDLYFRRLASTVHAVKVEDDIAQTLVRQLQLENVGLPQQCSCSSSIEISDSDAYPNDIYVDEDSDATSMDAARRDDEMALINDEAKEVLVGEESSPSQSEETNGSSEGSSEDAEEVDEEED